MGIAEVIIILAIALAFIAMFKNRKGVRGNGVYYHPSRDEDLARMRQMKEWDRYDKK